MKETVVDRSRSCFTLRGSKGPSHAHPVKDPGYPVPGGWLMGGISSLLLHGFLALALILGIQPGVRQSSLPVYRVTIRPLRILEKETPQKTSHANLARRSPVPPTKIETHRLGKEPVQEIKPRTLILPGEEPEQPGPAPLELAAAPTSLVERKRLSPPKEEDRISEPIPLPMASFPQPDTHQEPVWEDDPPFLLSSSPVGSDHKNAIPGGGPGEGPGAGSGDPGLGGTGDGPGGGQGDSGRGGAGVKLAAGHGGSSGGSAGKGRDVGMGNPGPGGHGSGGSENGDGMGRGRTGPGNSGNDGSGVPHPRYADNPKPVYPREARERRYEGEVLLRVEVLSNGRVGKIEVKRSSGYEVLDQSAFAAVKQWRFIPAMKGNVAIPFWVNIPIRFRLL